MALIYTLVKCCMRMNQDKDNGDREFTEGSGGGRGQSSSYPIQNQPGAPAGMVSGNKESRGGYAGQGGGRG